MSRLIYTYAIIRALYDKGEDYLDSFLALALRSLNPDVFMESGAIKTKLKEKYDFDIPIHVIDTILKRGLKRHYIDREEQANRIYIYKLTNKGVNYLDKLETDNEVERRINSLLSDIVDYFKSKSITITVKQANTLLLAFIQDNLIALMELIHLSKPLQRLQVRDYLTKENTLIDYINNAEEQKPNEYKIINDLIHGSIISTILYYQDITEIVEIEQRKFQKLQIFLDTNFILSLLELRHKSINQAAKELFELLKNNNFEIKVFDFTIDEVSRVLSRYQTSGYKYPTSVNIDDVCSSLKRKGWSSTQVTEFITNIESTLKNKGISVAPRSGINLRNYTKQNEYRDVIKIYKPDQDLFSQNHDLAAIEQIGNIRGQKIRHIEFSKAIFLSSDYKLCQFNYKEMGHKDSKTVCEVILDRLFANILWLKNPKSELPLKSIISSHSHNLFVNRRVWERFYEILKDLLNKRKIQKEDIAALIYHGNIEQALIEFGDEPDEVTEVFALDAIAQANKTREAEINQIRKETELEFIDRLDEAKATIKSTINKEIQTGLSSFKRELSETFHENARREARRNILIARVFTAIVFISPCIYCVITKWTDLFTNMLVILPILFFILGISGASIQQLWNKAQEKWTNKIYIRKLTEANLIPKNNQD